MRLGQLLLGLVLFGAWLGLVAELGVGPWDVLTGGLAELLGTSFGRTSVVVSVIVLLVGMAAGVRPGIGTLLNVGPGPRDGLMVAIHTRTGWPVGAARAALECAVLVVGVLLGGPVGIGTVLFAFGIGPAVQLAFRVLRQSAVRPSVAVAT